jgi:hypothetical protein
MNQVQRDREQSMSFLLPPSDAILIRRRTDGKLYRHYTAIQGPYRTEIYEFVVGVYDTEGRLKAKYWEEKTTIEEEQQSDWARRIYSLLGGCEKTD